MTDITVYGRASCVQCKATTDKAAQLGLTVNYVDLDKDPDTECRLVQEGHRQLPVVQAGDHCWTGYRPDLLGKVK
ncbi:NrdH-redoxin [Sinirhodobacter populi]|uniref:NrdH-redoxin n=1 Tax=Paenirhodobacter populi TaxID=2306993 RepID=A0A443K251_9RHOB|nr:glutaredoxin domain-containing protein [Sinirhodobacter populi]RWR26802.1 NrdH-redoxin [Sinirhodobacter populi]